MKQTKAQQIENCRQVLAMLATIPSQNLDLAEWRYGADRTQAPYCGTVACVGGWLPWWPHFAEMGVVVGYLGVPKARDGSSGPDLAFALFGDDDAFAPAGRHPADSRSRSDHDIAIHRFKTILRNLEAA